MKNLALLGGFLLACSAPAFGQAPDNPSQTPDTTRGQSSRSSSSERTETITGCLQQRGGKYVLMTENMHRNQNSASSTTQSEQQGTQTRHHAKEIELTGKDQDLQSHVGHTVTVTGALHHKSSMHQGNSNSSASEPNDKDPNAAQDNSQNTTSGKTHTTMRVESVQMVSDSCRTSGGSSSPQ